MARTHVDLSYENRLSNALSLCDHLVGSLPIHGFSMEKGGGGNWDDFAIEQVANRLGFQLRVSADAYSGIKRVFRDDLGALGIVRKLRNDLAHGSISFSECGENLTSAELRELAARTAAYLRDVVKAFETYIDEHQFLVPDKRPMRADA